MKASQETMFVSKSEVKSKGESKMKTTQKRATRTVLEKKQRMNGKIKIYFVEYEKSGYRQSVLYCQKTGFTLKTPKTRDWDLADKDWKYLEVLAKSIMG